MLCQNLTENLTKCDWQGLAGDDIWWNNSLLLNKMSITECSLWLSLKQLLHCKSFILTYLCCVSASSFELRYHQNLTTLLQFFNDAFDDFIILNGTLEPPEPFQLHNIHLELPIHDEVSADNTSSEAFYFAVRTLDANNNVAELSNVAFVSFYVHPKSGCGHLTCMSSWSLLLLLMMMIRYLLMP